MADNNVVLLRPCAHVPDALENIAEAYRRGDYGEGECCTIIIGREVFHLGVVDNAQAAMSAVFDCQWAIHKLMAAVERGG